MSDLPVYFDPRPLAERAAGFDWDGAVPAACREIVAILDAADGWQAVSQAFWDHFLAQPTIPREAFGVSPGELAAEQARSIEFIRIRYEQPFGERWKKKLIHYVHVSQQAHIPLTAFLAAMSRAHAQVLSIVAAAPGADADRMLRLADVVQRLALFESDAMARHLAMLADQHARQSREQRGGAFRTSIFNGIDAIARQGLDMRAQVDKASACTGDMLEKTSEVAAAAEQSAVAMREAAQTGRPDPRDRGRTDRGGGRCRDRQPRLAPGDRCGRHVGNAVRPREIDRIDSGPDPRHRRADQPAGAERDDRGGARR